MGWKQVLVSHLVLSFQMRNDPSPRLTIPVSLVMRAVMRIKLARESSALPKPCTLHSNDGR